LLWILLKEVEEWLQTILDVSSCIGRLSDHMHAVVIVDAFKAEQGEEGRHALRFVQLKIALRIIKELLRQCLELALGVEKLQLLSPIEVDPLANYFSISFRVAIKVSLPL